MAAFLQVEILDFTFQGSLFDLICVAVVRGALIASFFWILRVKPHIRVFPAFGLTVAFLTFGFGVVKTYFVFSQEMYPISQYPTPAYIMLTSYLVVGIAYIVCGIGATIGAFGPKKPASSNRNGYVAIPQLPSGSSINSDGVIPIKNGVAPAAAAGAERPVPSFRRIAALAIPEIPLLAFAVIMLVIASAALLVVPVFFGLIIQAIRSGEGGHAALMNNIYGLLAAAVIGSVAVMLRALGFQLAGQRVVARLRIDLYKCIIKQDVSFFDTEKVGELTNRISTDTQVLQETLTTTMSQLLRNLVTVIGALVILFVTSWKLTLVMLAVVPVITFGAIIYGNALKKMQAKFQDQLAASVAIASESIGAIRTVRTFVREPKLMEDFSFAIIESYAWGSKIAIAWAVFQAVIFLVSQGAIVLVIWYGYTLIEAQELDLASLIAFMLYSITIAASVAMLSNVFGTIMQAVGASARVFQLMDQVPEIPIAGGMDLPVGDGVISFDNVSFHYPSRKEANVLQGVSFQLRPGRITALVGKSGSGKSTIVQLIERFYDPSDGRISFDGVDLRDLDPALYRRNIGYVKQEPTLFSATVKENILFGVEDPSSVSDEQLHAAAKAANCHDFIMEFAKGYDTEVGERGVQLSGGQRARVAVARALILNPKILLLDEATAALDAESEHLVTQAIERAMQDRTVLVIAHRLSTVKNADQVLVMSNGKIVETGTHSSLLAQDGVYASLIKRQLANNTINSLEEPSVDELAE